MSNKRRWVADGALAGAALAGTLLILGARGLGPPSPGTPGLDPVAVALAVLTAAPLAVRRQFPGTAYAVSAVASLALLRLGYPLDIPVATAPAAYTLAVARAGAPLPRRLPALIAVHAFVPVAVLLYASDGYRVWDLFTEMFTWAVLFAGAWLAGDRSRLRELRLAEARAYAERVRQDAERERRLAAADERTRIARELHDSAGHAINVILVQAGAARLLQERDPERARAALTAVESVARDTITDIDRLVRALRDDRDVPADPGALDALIERHRANGLRIAADLPETSGPLPRSVAWAAYRILQEALTNAARHGAGSAEVAVRFRRDRVEIDVTNPALSEIEPETRTGHGIVGMRERATLLGGTLRADHAADGLFRLSATLPVT
ncbi:sensor histidine kinase [Paractinoplanes rishiriensis]|uniref:histidine kinase n=1 Tax=Paractinoplanes rishiriensis TaxID=1050105 RepID=A0A919K9U8_9ACTN|nr:histidine kinase [Actinoplanes rishiriensis]GIF01383.1 two-component sensor histidine kinase [Actinoplanes rishiriensis]